MFGTMKTNKIVYVIHEKDLDDQEESVIGVADSLENADKIINEYYRDFKSISFNDIRDSNLEYSRIIEVRHAFDSARTYEYELTVERFVLNVT